MKNNSIVAVAFASAWFCVLTLIQPGLSAAQESAAPEQVAPPRRSEPQRRANQRMPDELQFVRDVVYATIERDGREPIELAMDVMFGKNNDNQAVPVILYIHGGGYSRGSKNGATELLKPLALGGYCAISVEYRLSGVAPWPAAIHDCKAAIRFIRANAEQLGIDPERIGVWGHSAGGHLAALVAVSGNEPSLEGDVGTKGVSSSVRCAVDICGPSDFTRMDRSIPIHAHVLDTFFAGPADSLNDRLTAASTINHVDGNDPPIMIVHGTNDRVVPIEHSQWFRDALEHAGVEHEFLPVQGAGHDISDPSAYEAIAAFFDKNLGGHCAEAMRSLRWENPPAERERDVPQRGPQDEGEQRQKQPGDATSNTTTNATSNGHSSATGRTDWSLACFVEIR